MTSTYTENTTRPPAAVSRYLAARTETLALDPDTAPMVVQMFRPGRGWQAAAPLPITPRGARALARAGVTAVSLDLGGDHRADFRTADLING
jgi:hypothetical protein